MVNFKEWCVRPIKWGISPCDIVCFMGVVGAMGWVIFKILLVGK